MKNANFWVRYHHHAWASGPERVVVSCMTHESAGDITRVHKVCGRVGYQGSAWDITKIKRVCSTVFYFEAQKVPPVKGASFSVAFNLD